MEDWKIGRLGNSPTFQHSIIPFGLATKLLEVPLSFILYFLKSFCFLHTFFFPHINFNIITAHSIYASTSIFFCPCSCNSLSTDDNLYSSSNEPSGSFSHSQQIKALAAEHPAITKNIVFALTKV